MPKKLTTQEFIEKARLIHDDKYDYSKIEYKNYRTKVRIICKVHGEFWQLAGNHLAGSKCLICCNKNKTVTTQEFIEKAKLIHDDKYDYSKVEYINNRTKVCIICPTHGEFWQKSDSHLNKIGCIKCGNAKKILTTNKFIKKAKLVHNNKYDYSKTNYINNRTKVRIICKVHGEFWQLANNHTNESHGCPNCSESKGERKIRNYLIENKIQFEREKKFNNCKNKKLLPFDFYLPNNNLLIEYDGLQHFKSINYFGGNKGFQIRKKLDSIKSNYCKKNNINLLRIPYTEFNSIELQIKKATSFESSPANI